MFVFPQAPARTTPRADERPPCAVHPTDWDMDSGSTEGWRAAIQVCRGCPLLSACQAYAERLAAQGEGPIAMIWAGVAYDPHGRIVEDVQYYCKPSDHRRRFRIFRMSHTTAASTCTPRMPAPRRHIVLGRTECRNRRNGGIT